MKRWIFVLTFACATPLPAAPPEAREVTAAFTAVLQSDDFAKLAAVSAGGGDPARRWKSFTELLERFECQTVDDAGAVAVEQDGERALVRIEIDGVAETAGRRKRTVALPRIWYVDAVATPAGVRFRDVATAERRAARKVVAGTMVLDDALAARELDAHQLLIAVTDEALDAKTPRAIDAVEQVVALAREWQVRDLEAHALRRLSSLEVPRNPGRVLEAAQQSLALANEIGDPDGIAASHYRVAVGRLVTGAVPAAMEHFQAVAGSVGEQTDPRQAMLGIYMVGYLERQLGRLQESTTASEQLAAWAEEFDWDEGRAFAAGALATVYADVGDYDMSLHHYTRAYEIARRTGDQQAATIALHNRAVAQLSRGNLEEAATLDREAARLAEKHVAVIVPVVNAALANTVMQLGRFEEAEEAVCRGMAFAGANLTEWERFDLTLSLSEIRQKQGRHAEALALADESRAIQRRAEATPKRYGTIALGRVESAVARPLRSLGRREEAIDELRAAVASIEGRRAALPGDVMASLGFLTDKLFAYRDLIDVLIEARRADEALIIAEQMKARGLRDIIERGQADLDAAMSAERRIREEELNMRIVALNKQLRERLAPAKEATLRRQLESARLELQELLLSTRLIALGERPPASRGPEAAIDRLRDELPEDVVILDYVVLDRRTIVFALTRDGGRMRVTARVIPISSRQLTQRVEKLIDASVLRDLHYAAEARALYDTLIAPVAGSLSRRTLVNIIPDGVLWKLPFSILGRSADATLLDRMAVAYAPSLAMLREPRDGRAATGPLLAMANPVGRASRRVRPGRFRYAALEPLPDAEKEVREIARLYPDSRVYIRSDAAEKTLKDGAHDFRVLHLATHGIMDSGSPMYSALLLAPSEREDGLLEAREIAAMRLDADLAVLSACEMAGGSVNPGEGLIGMSWALMVAGCPTSVVSQWKVASSSTAELMVALHRELVAGVRPAEALRRAQLRLRRRAEYSHPFYWASFVVMGTSW